MPLIPMPPNGAVRSRTRKALTQMVPARTARPTRSARAAELVTDLRGEPVLGRVGEPDRLLLVGEGLQGEHRAEDLALDDLGVVGRRLDQRRLVPEARRGVVRAAAADDPVARGARALDEALDAREVVGVDERRDRRRGVARVAEHVRVRVAAEALQERLADRLLDEQPRAGEADLAGVVVLARGLLGGRVEVGVGEHDQRALAAELARERDEVAGGGHADVARRSPASR